MQQAISHEQDLVTKQTRALLICGVVAGPLYTIVGLIQAFTRPGFDITPSCRSHAAFFPVELVAGFHSCMRRTFLTEEDTLFGSEEDANARR